MNLAEGRLRCESFRTRWQTFLQNEEDVLEKLSDSDSLTCGSLTHTVSESHIGYLWGTRWLQRSADSSATPQWNINTFPHISYRVNIIASSDPNITISPHKGCAIHTDEETAPRYYIQKCGLLNSSLISQLTIIKEFWWGNLRVRDHLGDPDVDGRIILRWIFRKWDVGVWTGSSWLRIGTGGGHLWMR